MSQVCIDRLVMSQHYDKSNLKLDLENKATNSRKRKFLGVPSPAILQSPDLKLLKLASPELEKLIIHNNGFIPTPTPGGNSSLIQTGENSADDQESFARGFIEALQKLQEQDVPLAKSWDVISIDTVNNSTSTNPVVSSKSSTASNPPRWQVDHNRNSVPVITTRFDNRTPPLCRPPTSTPVLINFPTVSSGAVSTMGMTAVPRASTSYVSRPGSDQSRLSHQTTHPLTTSGITLPMPIVASSTSSMLSSSPMLEPVQIKSEDEAIVPNPDMNLDMSPINLEVQEHIKHQRKKLRNRLAAQRCRKRKIEREDTLKAKVKELKTKNTELTSLASTLRMQVCDLKQQVMHHVNEGCQVFLKDEEDKMAKSS